MTWPCPRSTISGNHQTGHGKQCFDIGIKHDVPFVRIAFVFLVHADYQSGIIYEDIYRFPFFGKRVESRFRSPTVANVERQQTDIRMVFRFQFALYGSQFLYIPSVENQAVAIHGKFTRTALSYTRRSTCDEYDFLSILIRNLMLRGHKVMTYCEYRQITLNL